MKAFLQKSALTLVVASCFFVTQPLSARATSDLEVSGWIPYWSVKAGTKDAKKHLDELSMIHPFSYTVKKDGTLSDLGKMSQSSWKSLLRSAKSKDVLVVPTVMTSDGSALHTILSNKKSRAKHVKAIASLVKKQKYDGIDIDYEGKMAETKDYYSDFLKELKKALGDKILSCTVEARTPPESLYITIPDPIRYANDYAVIAKYCDRVNIMAYDQRNADINLNREKKGEPYMPIADTDWVRKVVEYTLNWIPKEKIVLGVATYGHEYEIVTAPDWYRDYNRVRALNIPAMEKLAKKYDAIPSRNSAGEISFTYFPNENAPQFKTNFPIPKNTSDGNIVGAQTLAYSTKTGVLGVFYYVTWSDAGAIAEKVDLAKELGIKGIALFKIDGQEDKDIWELFE